MLCDNFFFGVGVMVIILGKKMNEEGPKSLALKVDKIIIIWGSCYVDVLPCVLAGLCCLGQVWCEVVLFLSMPLPPLSLLERDNFIAKFIAKPFWTIGLE